MNFEREESIGSADRLVEEAVKELGLFYQEQETDSERALDDNEKSPSEVAVERFRLEYGRRVRAASVE